MSYKGDISATECFDVLSNNKTAQLIDVRSQAEWSFVGVPDLSAIGKQVSLIEWVQFPSQTINENFTTILEQSLEEQGLDKTVELFFICRSGARSQSAAAAMTACGYANCYNVLGGFEGCLNQERHRGLVDGWKAENLPWVQQ